VRDSCGKSVSRGETPQAHTPGPPGESERLEATFKYTNREKTVDN
jgi:hypothetical protein